MGYEHRKQVIDNWLACYIKQCETLGMDSQRGLIPRFLDDVVLHLWTNKFDPTNPDCEFESFDEAETYHIGKLREQYGYIINVIPLEVMFLYAYTHVEDCYLPEYIFDDDFKVEDIHTFTGLVNRYTHRFNPKMERLLVQKLNIKKLLN